MSLDPFALKARADEILDAMPENGLPTEDRIAEAVELARQSIKAEEAERSTWAPVDLETIIAGEGDLEPAPAMLSRTDGEKLVYAGKITSLASEPEGGKGWCRSRLSCATTWPSTW